MRNPCAGNGWWRKHRLVEVERLALLLLCASLFQCTAASAGTLEVPVYDATPEPGKPISLAVTAFTLYDDQRNLKDPIGQMVSLRQEGGRLQGEYVFKPDRPLRYALIFDLRVDGWRMTDRRTVYIDYHNAPKLPPFTFRPVILSEKRGGFSTGETTILQQPDRTLIVHLGTDRLAHVFTLGEPLRYHVEIQAPGPVRAEAFLVDWHGGKKRLEKWTGPGRHEVVARVQSPGFYRLRVRIDGWGEAELDGGVLSPCGAKNDRIGINVHWTEWCSQEQMEGSAQLLGKQGVRWVRGEYEWKSIEPVRGDFNWWQYDLIADVCKRHHLSMLPCMFRVPRWASTAPDSPDWTHHIMKREFFGDYFNYVMAVAKRYHGWIDVISVWNEVDSAWFQGGTPQDYLELLKGCSERLKAFDPKLKTTCSGMSASGRSTAADLLRTVLKLGGKDYFDIFDCHYASRDTLALYNKDLKPYGAEQKPVWITEQSANQIPDRSLAGASQTAADKVKGMIQALAGNPEKVFLWGEIDQHPNINPWGNIKGTDRTLRPSYFAFAALIDLLAERRCTKVYSETSDLHAYRFGADLLVLWSDSDTVIGLDGQGSGVERIDLMGAKATLPASAGREIIPIGPEPIYVRCARPPADLRPVVAFTQTEYGITPGQQSKIGLRIRNPWPTPASVDVHFELPAGWSATPMPGSVKLRAGAERTVSMSVLGPEDAPAGKVLGLKATVRGLGKRVLAAGAAIRMRTKAGVTLIEAESASRSQGPCPGAPMWIGDNQELSGGAEVQMFWGGSWMEYDVPFAKPGSYRLGVFALGRFSGHPDEKPVPINLAISLDGGKADDLNYSGDKGRILQFLDLSIPKAGNHTVRIEFPIDAGDVFVDYLTIEPM